ncbi:hypothetical protein [Cyclobacterium marinum]|uniref:hypothetical protein n=1 Tax=Cyclobacterium marinum TaxID=104 RepID=UPI0011ED1916|nr:hypothetical protein [Cyclobacterium marinum]MBI0401363.1 hypothetical protein [Cyclobacterium marinum]
MGKNFDKYFNFDIGKISKEVNSLIDQGKLKKAQRFLQQIEKSYSVNKRHLNINKAPFQHLLRYSLDGIFDPDSSGGTVVNYFLKTIHGLKEKVSNKINIQRSLDIGEMNYLELVLIANILKKKQKKLEKFFYRKYKKAKKEYYDADEFFGGCLKLLDVFDQILQQKVNDRERELYLMIDWSNYGCLTYDNLGEGPKHTDPEKEKIFNSFKDQLESNNKSNFSVHLPSITLGKYTGELWEEDITFIRSEIEKARQKIDSEELLTTMNGEHIPKLKIDQIALIFVYEEYQITRKNAAEIVNRYGHESGEKLFQRFTFYSSAANRKGKPHPFTLKKLNNKIQLLESVITLLPVDKQERAKDEVTILRKISEAEFS